MKRPYLTETEIPSLSEIIKSGKPCITMGPNQWDNLLQQSYDRGHLLLQIEDKSSAPDGVFCPFACRSPDERVSKAFRKKFLD